MDDVWAYFLTIFINIIHVKLFSQKGIPLNSNHGIFFTVYIFRIDIYFWSVESGLSDILSKWNIQFCQNLADIFFCLIPNFRLADIFFTVFRIPFTQMIRYIFLNTKCLQTVLSKSDTILKLFYHLVRTHNQMAFRNCKLAHTSQAVHFTGILITEQC